MKKTLYLVALLASWASCPWIFAQTPAWTGAIDGLDTTEEPSYINLHSPACGWFPVFEGTDFVLLGKLKAGETVEVYGKADGPYSRDGEICVNQIDSATRIAGLSGSNYTKIVNGEPWPLDFRPYCYNVTPNPKAPCPYNDKLPDDPQKLLNLTLIDPVSGDPVRLTSAGVINAMNAQGDLTFGLQNAGYNLGDDGGGFPEYLAASTDPIVIVTCLYWCQNGIGSKDAVKIHIPKKAEGSPGLCPGDCQMGIIEPDGTEYAIYGMTVNYSGGSTISAAGLAWASIVSGSGVDPNGVSLAYPGNGGGDVSNGSMFAVQDNSIRVNEIDNGEIPHALHMSMACATGQVYPGSNAYDCYSNYGYTGPPAGARFQFVLNDAQIDGTQRNSIGYNATKAAAWEKVILRAMHDYGIVGDITCGRECNASLNIYTESSEQYTQFDKTWPVSTFNWNSPGTTGPYQGGIGLAPINWTPGGLNWAKALRIVDPCYSLEQCTQ
jgi:hypothetical protein